MDKKKGKMFAGCSPPVKYPRKTGTVLSLFDFDPEEIARQMTVTDFALFAKIRPTELMNQVCVYNIMYMCVSMCIVYMCVCACVHACSEDV